MEKETSRDRAAWVLEAYGTPLYRMCLVMLRTRADAEDAVQETLLRYLERVHPFADAAHERAWLFTVAANYCRNRRRFFLRHRQLPLDETTLPAQSEPALPNALTRLPEKYALVLHLHYIEGYRAQEIARMLKLTPHAVFKRLERGRTLLKKEWEDEE